MTHQDDWDSSASEEYVDASWGEAFHLVSPPLGHRPNGWGQVSSDWSINTDASLLLVN